MDLDFEIFKGKKLSDLFKEIHKNSTKKADQIDILIGELQKLVNTPNEALMIVPMIKEFLDVSVRNDEALIKLAVIVQRVIASANEGGDGGDTVLSDSERQQLLDAAREAAAAIEQPKLKAVKTVDVTTVEVKS
jgi:GAF domain-containing protein